MSTPTLSLDRLPVGAAVVVRQSRAVKELTSRLFAMALAESAQLVVLQIPDAYLCW